MSVQGIIGAQTEPAVRGNMTPPRGSQPTGEMFNGQPVYKRPVRQFKRVPARDADGNILYHLNPDGTKRAPQWTREEVAPIWEEFILEDGGNGMVRKNFYFRPTEDDYTRARLAEGRTERETKLDSLVVALEKEGLSIDDVVAVVGGLVGKKQPEKPKTKAKAAKPGEPEQKTVQPDDNQVDLTGGLQEIPLE